MKLPLRHVLCALAFLVAGAAQAQAQSFPTRPVTLLVPFAPGGTSDQAARLIAAKFQESTGQPMLVENKAGANGQTAIAALKQQPADGYTLFWGSIGTHAINAALYAKLNYDPVKDFEPVSATFSSTHFLLVPATSPAKTVAEFVTLAKAKGGSLNIASVGIGSGSHLVGEMFKAKSGIQLGHVPYKGSASALPDVIGGRIDVFFDGPTSAPLVKEGKLRALAATDSQRAPVLPDVPTMAEAGFPGVELNAWFGIFAPAGTPKAVVTRLNAEIVKALRQPDVIEKVHGFGGAVIAGTPEALAQRVARESDRLGKLVRAVGVKAE
ncbi:tripartite tricarboxylate transporter substrate binding protein [Aquincola sp. S2]|uniref:Tripartite tricarboxylate transporter substrate binding protein n=1 Tax=Pseudaquabacterium terrae TaxID=2732868 RepID=A0ABX2ET39_9BURK|nr:tripartite tricarboxylate transporter substrate binding protein [Aquabacterium terrae]NRF71869.1 tripartite tricarboxylate transporter substrate binding protein [Aquabacterium terrae]